MQDDYNCSENLKLLFINCELCNRKGREYDID